MQLDEVTLVLRAQSLAPPVMFLSTSPAAGSI